MYEFLLGPINFLKSERSSRKKIDAPQHTRVTNIYLPERRKLALYPLDLLRVYLCAQTRASYISSAPPYTYIYIYIQLQRRGSGPSSLCGGIYACARGVSTRRERIFAETTKSVFSWTDKHNVRGRAIRESRLAHRMIIIIAHAFGPLCRDKERNYC